MFSLIFVFVLLVQQIHVMYAADILAIVGAPSYSHQVAFYPLWRELSLKGHKVLLITTDPIKDQALTNLTEIDLHFAYDVMEEHNFTENINRNAQNPLKFIPKVADMFNHVIDEELSHPEIKSLIQNRKRKFDVVIAEVFFPTMVAFGHRFNCPVIGAISMDAHGILHEFVGNPNHPVLYPETYVPFAGELGFLERVLSTVLSFLVNTLLDWYTIAKEDLTVKKHFGEDYPDLKKLIQNMSLLFINGDHVFRKIRPTGPSTIYIGGGDVRYKSSPQLSECPTDCDLANPTMDLRVSSFLIILCISVNESARILGVIPTPSFSHQLPFRPIWRELSLRGHQVVVLTTDPISDPTLTNLTEIDLHFSYRLESVVKVITNEVHDYPQNPMTMLNTIINAFTDVCSAQLQHPEVQQLLNDDTQNFDLVMVEILNPIMFGFQHKYKCPFIGLVSMDAQLAAYDAVGNPSHPVLNPDFMLPLAGKLSFLERVSSVIYSVLIRWYGEAYIVPVSEREMKKWFGQEASLRYSFNLDMLLINANPFFHGIRPVVPAIVYVGGGLHLSPPKALPEELQAYLDGAKNGVIYFSLGSNVKSKDIADETKRIIIESLGELPYSVLWKYEADNLDSKSENIKIMKWIPQENVLRHPNVKLFITQGGLQSIEEAIFAHVPMIGMPFFGDQIGNVKKIVLHGIGLQVDHKSLTKAEFMKTIVEIISNSTYKENIKNLAEISQDQPMTGLEKAVWWTEYVIRHKGAKHLRNPAIDVPWYQYFLLDVIGFLIVVFSLATYITVKVFQLLFRVLRNFVRTDKIKTS